LTGYFYDKLGSYTAAFFVCIALAVLALAVMFLIRPVTKSHLTKF
jgi:hypothetical protein